MSEKVKEMLDEFVVTLEMSVRDVNVLLNAINLPSQVPATTAIYFINLIQGQAGPQVEKAKGSLEAVEKANES